MGIEVCGEVSREVGIEICRQVGREDGPLFTSQAGKSASSTSEQAQKGGCGDESSAGVLHRAVDGKRFAWCCCYAKALPSIACSCKATVPSLRIPPARSQWLHLMPLPRRSPHPCLPLHT